LILRIILKISNKKKVKMHIETNVKEFLKIQFLNSELKEIKKKEVQVSKNNLRATKKRSKE
jgi:predicted transcriptional regulator